MITYKKYINNEEHCWYNSSNIVYSVIFDDQKDGFKSIKIVFKGGRTYLYRNVDPMQYVLFRDSHSQGKTFNEFIKHCECIKQDDTDLSKLEEMKNKFMEINTSYDTKYHMKINNDTGEFKLFANNVKIFESIEGNVSVINLFKAMDIDYSFETTDEHNTTTEEFENKIITD